MTTASSGDGPTMAHQPERPFWHCRSCRAAWPCDAARTELASSLPRTALAIYMTVQLGVAAGDMPSVEPSELYLRFLQWTRSAPPSIE